MATITLDDIRQAIERKYAPVVIEFGDGKSCTLRQALRLPKEDRARLRQLQENVNTEGETEEDLDAAMNALREIIRVAATSKTEANALLKAVGEDELVLTEILQKWTDDTQAGEASGSAN